MTARRSFVGLRRPLSSAVGLIASSRARRRLHRDHTQKGWWSGVFRQQQPCAQPSPRQLSLPSLNATAAMKSAAAGSAHHEAGGGVHDEPDEQCDGKVGAELGLRCLLDRGGDPSWWPTRRLTRASIGIVTVVKAARPMPIQLASGCWPPARVRTDSTPTYAARTKKLAAISCWARRSAASEPIRAACEEPEDDETRERLDQRAAPKPIRAIEPAAIPAPIAIANSTKW